MRDKNMQGGPSISMEALAQSEDVVCENCGNYTFQEVALMKRMSPIMSPNGQELMVPMPVFACNACGFINKSFLPFYLQTPDKIEEDVRPTLVIEK